MGAFTNGCIPIWGLTTKLAYPLELQSKTIQKVKTCHLLMGLTTKLAYPLELQSKNIQKVKTSHLLMGV